MPPCLALPNAHVCGERGGVHDVAMMIYEPFGASCLRMWTAVLLRPQLSHSLHARCLLPRKCADPLTSVDLASKRVWWIRRCEYGQLTHQRSAPRSATSPALAAPRTGLAGCKRLAVLRAVHRGHKHPALSLFGFISRKQRGIGNNNQQT